MDIKKIVDTINRDGYEWFWNFLLNNHALREQYKIQYKDRNPMLRLLGSVVWRLPLMIIPVIPAFYVLTRTVGVILNPMSWYKNRPKPLAMLSILALSAAVVAAANFAASSPFLTEWVPFAVKASFQAPLTVGLLVWAGVLVGAGLMYAAKKVAQHYNAKNHGNLTTRKHLMKSSDDLPLNMLRVHEQVRDKTHELKFSLAKRPDQLTYAKTLAGDRKPSVNNRETTDLIDATKETISLGKNLMADCESLMAEQKKGLPLVKSQFEALTTQYNLWRSGYGAVKDDATKLTCYTDNLSFENGKIIEKPRPGL